MTLSKKIRRLALAASLLTPAMVIAEDIDLFQGGAGITGSLPNVLIVLDNAANFSSSAAGEECKIDGVATALSGTVGGIEQCALYNVIKGLDVSSVNIGMMVYNSTNIKDINNANCGGSNGGCLAYPLSVMDATNKDAILTWIKKWRTTGGAGDGYIKASGEATAATMQEAWAYYKGATGLSGRNYAGVQPAGGCQKNYVIFVGNSFSSAGTPGDTGSSSPKAALESAPGITAAQTALLTGTFSTSCGDLTFPTATSTHENKGDYADEWARYMQGTDLYSSFDGTQNITTYTIGVLGDSCQAEYAGLLDSMAKVGGGKYFPTTDYEGLVVAFLKVLNEVQAVNSVFTSASLPVSVNTQGTYLNQIYMGVFRPDAHGNPRWLGNLKQYKFGVTTDTNGNDKIFLSDALGLSAINSQTGFITPGATSYWSTSTAPNPGFWAFNPQGSGGQYDAPDGDIVEKGGAAQKLRTLGPTARTVKTCLGDCSGGLVSFDTSNTALVTTLSGTSASVSLSRAGTTVTATTSSDLGLASNDTVTIGSATVAAYNATWPVTRVDATHFTFTINETPATPGSGATMTVSAGSVVPQTVPTGGLTFDSNTSSATYGKAFVNLPAHGFISGQPVTISGATGATSDQVYNGTYAITVTDSGHFTYTPTLATSISYAEPAINTTLNTTGTPRYDCKATTTATYGSATIYHSSTSAIIKVITANSSTNGTTLCQPGNTLELVGLPTGFASSYTIVACPGTFPSGYPASVKNKTFCASATVTTPTVYPVSPATGTIVASGVPTRSISSITRTAGNASNIATVTVTTTAAHGFTGSSVTVNGANLTAGAVDGTEYNGTKTSVANSLAYPTATTITYTITTGPTASATGTATKGSDVDGNTLISWMRGVDNKDDENNSGTFTDVRASIHGDVLHSRPLVINYGGTTGIVSYYGANDGTLHAVKGGQAGTDGVEKWAFIAPEHYSSLGRIYSNSPVIKFPNTSMSIEPTPTKRNYYFDGNIGVYQSADLATTHIFPSMRRGGRFIYALNVSNPDSPAFLWKKTSNDADTRFRELGYTWSEPKVIPIKKTTGVACSASDPTTYTRGLIFGAGYDPDQEDLAAGTVRNPTMGRGVFVLNAANGNIIKLLQPADNKKYSFPADVTLLDTDGDGCVDRVYAVDTGANIFRFDIGDADPNNWKTYKLAALGDVGNNGGSDDRKFMYPADAVLGFIGQSQVAYIVVGSGNREDPRSTTINDNFFMIKDTVPTGTNPSDVTAVVFGDLIQITNFNAATTTVDPTLSSFKGYYIPFETGEKSVNAPLTIAGTTFFGTNKPKAASNTSCEPNLGVARGYAINYLNGTSAAGDRDGNGTIDRNDLYSDFAGGGLPPSPVGGLVQIGDKTFRFLIGGGGDGTEGSPIEGSDFKANPSSNRTRVFWYFKKDE